MVQVLERGCGFTQVLCKGLELQETSCHHVEAGAVEEIMDSALGDCTLSSAPPALPWKNPWTINTLEPLTKIPATVYSLADTQMTGIINRSENADELPRFFARALLWLLRRREAEKGTAPSGWFDFRMLEDIEGRSLDSAGGTYHWDAEWAKAIGLSPPAPLLPSPAVACAPAGVPASADVKLKAVQAHAAAPAAAPISSKAIMPTAEVTKNSGFWGKKKDPEGQLWTANSSASPPTRAIAVLPSATPLQATGGKNVEDDMDIDDLDDLLDEFSVAGGHFGSEELDADSLLDELDESLGLRPACPANQLSATSSSTRAHATLDADVGAGAAARSTGHNTNDQGSRGNAELRKWLGACWGILEEWGHLTSKSGPEHTAMVFAGELPRSSHAKWLDDSSRHELKELVLMAFRYGVKFAYDTCLYGAEDTHNELTEYFTEYDAKWHFGPENSPGWAAAVENGVPNLMAIWKEKGACRGRVASLVESHMQVGRLNGQAVRGLWAALSMELYYFTNDDDERYSIQSNTALLRNLMVQTAAPPLGYPLYVCNAN